MADRSLSRASTPLQCQLAGTMTARPTALDAFRHARRTFLAGDRVDMQALARRLNVDRATLYRWVGSREQLLTEVLWSLIDPTINTLRKVPNASQPATAGQSPAAAVITGTSSSPSTVHDNVPDRGTTTACTSIRLLLELRHGQGRR